MGLLTRGDRARSGCTSRRAALPISAAAGRKRMDPRSQTWSRPHFLSPFIFNTHLPATPTGRRQRWQQGLDRQAGAGGFSWLGRTAAWHKRMDVAGERHLETAAREERQAQEKRALQNHFDHFYKLEMCKSRSRFASMPLPLPWVGNSSSLKHEVR